MSKLSIAWLTPWNEKSAIALSASQIADELELRGHEVSVFRTEVGPSLDHLMPLPASREINVLERWPSEDIKARFDVAVAHIGDHPGFHGALPSRLRELGIVGVFHDAFLADLSWGYLGGDEPALRALNVQTYGVDAWPSGEHYLQNLADVMNHRPMVEWLACQTVAAVAHAEHYAQRLRNACPGPVAVMPLAFAVPEAPPMPRRWSKITVATIGHANANKRIDQVVLAVASSHVLRRRCRIKVIGAIEPNERARLEHLALALGALPMHFTGWVSDEDMGWQMRDVDVISCLRNPVLEGASASLVFAMCSGRPTLVTDHGCYAEYPQDTLMKCSPDNEAVDVLRHLERLLCAPTHCSAIGERARELATRRHSPAAYVDALLPLLHEVIRRRPATDAARNLTNVLTGFGLSSRDPARARLQDSLNRLLA